MEKDINIVKKVCKELGITQADLARKLDVSPPTITEWSKGNIPKMTYVALELIIENKQLKAHLENVNNFYKTLQKLKDIS
jgi:predicted transcriptional regulator